MINNILKVFKILILKSPKNFVSMCLMLSLELVVIAFSVFTLIPLADYILDPTLSNPSKFSKYVLGFLSFFEAKTTFFNLGIFFIIGQLLRGVLTSTINFFILKIKYEFIKKINEESLNQVLSAKWNFFSASNYGNITNIFTREINNIGQTIGHIAKSFAAVAQLCFFISIPMYLNFKLTLVIIIMFGLFGIIIIKYGNPLSFKLGQKNVSTANKLMSSFIETLQGSKIIKINSKEKFFVKKHLNKFDQHVDATLKSQMLHQVFNAFFQPLGIIILVSVFSIFINHGIPLSELAAIFYSLISIVSLLNTLVGMQINISNFIPSYEQLELLINKAKKLKENFGNIEFQSFKKNIEFKDVNFFYDEEKQVLKNLNFNINKNKITAIVGQSGSGKSTIADLIIGIISPQSGKIIVDGKVLTDYQIDSYRNKIGYVSQDIFLFNDTIKNNLKWFTSENIEEDKMWEALKLSGADKFVNELPEKINTVVGERGVQLSGGQRQRLSLSRSFLKFPQILILDEATSSLDSLSENEIQDALNNLKSKGDITFLIIAHRLSTIKKADEILLLDDGHVKERGNYTQLKSISDGKFNLMLKTQITNN